VHFCRWPSACWPASCGIIRPGRLTSLPPTWPRPGTGWLSCAFDLSYRDLTPGQQRLFRRLGLVPGTTVDAYAAAALDDSRLEEARESLAELYDQHLLTEPTPGRYQLHDLLREHAHTLAVIDDPDESGAPLRRQKRYRSRAPRHVTAVPAATTKAHPVPGQRS
jgi:hypothetical protein